MRVRHVPRRMAPRPQRRCVPLVRTQPCRLRPTRPAGRGIRRPPTANSAATSPRHSSTHSCSKPPDNSPAHEPRSDTRAFAIFGAAPRHGTSPPRSSSARPAFACYHVPRRPDSGLPQSCQHFPQIFLKCRSLGCPYTLRRDHPACPTPDAPAAGGGPDPSARRQGLGAGPTRRWTVQASSRPGGHTKGQSDHDAHQTQKEDSERKTRATARCDTLGVMAVLTACSPRTIAAAHARTSAATVVRTQRQSSVLSV